MFIPHMSLLQRRSIFTTRGSQLLLVTTVTTILTSTSQFCIFQPVQGFLSSLGSNRIVEYQRYHSSSSNNNNNDVDVDETDLTRWDQLYQQGSVRRNRITEIMNPPLENDEDSVAFSSKPSPVRVITFDLDNTLWNTGATISAANDAVAQYLNDSHIQQSKRTEVIMGELFQASKAKYCPLDGVDGKSPVLLTQLRKDALAQILIHDNGYSEEDAKTFAEQAFQKWIDARYAAIPYHCSTNVFEVLEVVSKLRERSTIENNSSQQAQLLIGAITDGNSDPRNIPQLAPYFDFCVNAEQVGVSKPDKRVYLQAAIEHVFSASGKLQDMGLSTIATHEQAENAIGPWWIHIGDDFTKDIVAAKNLNMRTVWARELILDKIRPKPSQDDVASQNTDSDQPKLSPEKELIEFQKKINSKTVVKMAVGAEDYLSTSIEREFAGAIIDCFDELPSVLQQWHDQSFVTSGEEMDVTTILAINQAPVAPANPADSTDDSTNGSINGEEGVMSATKFCVFCGTKVPMVAKFCSACSKEQPQV